MSKKRIVKETLDDGTVQYRVEVFQKSLFFLKGYWQTDTYFYPFGSGVYLEAVFDTLEEAEEHVFGYSKSKKVVKREILNYE